MTHFKNYLTTALLSLVTITNLLIAETITLEEKLNHQFELYERLHNETIMRLTPNIQEIPFTRPEWEVFLMPSKEMQLHLKDLNELRSFHAKIAEEAKIHYAKNSGLDLAPLRNNQRLLKEFVTELPKGGMLNMHSYGTLDRHTAKDILLRHDPLLDGQKLLNNICDDEQILLYNN